MSASRLTGIAARVACAAAVLTVAACDEPINQRYMCSIEDVVLDGFCLEHEDTELSDEVCTYICEQWLETEPIDGYLYDCDEVEVENTTQGYPTVCEIDVDWVDMMLEDSDAGLTHRYSCGAPWQDGEYFCAWDVDEDGTEELGEGTYLGYDVFHGCGIDSTAGHQSCIDDCAAQLQATNDYLAALGSDCSFSIYLCDSIAFANELEGQFCDAAGMAVDRAGDRAQEIVWSTADGGAATRPLACSLSGNCCEAYGAAVCSNLALGTPEFPAAEHVTGIAGTLTFASDTPGVGPVVATVNATVRSSFHACRNSAGTCPLYLEDIQIQLPQHVSGIVYNGARYDLTGLSATLAAPALGVADMRTGAVKLLGDRASLRVAATARMPDKGLSFRVEEAPELPAAIDARLNAAGEIVQLSTSIALPGSADTLTIQLGGTAGPNGGRQ